MPLFTRIASYTNPHEAEVVRGLLQDHGIDAVLQDNMSVHMNWLYSNAIGGVKLLVPTDDVHDALALLEIPPADTLDHTDSCPSCGSSAIKDLRRPFIPSFFNMAIIILTGLFMFPFGYRRDRHECLSCGTTW